MQATTRSRIIRLHHEALVHLITIAMSTAIGAQPGRVWRALTQPEELLAWDEHMLAAIDAPPDYPTAGQHMRWRYRLGPVQVVLHDRPQEILPFQRLHTSLAISSMRFEQTYSLTPETPAAGHGETPPATRLGLKLTASNSVPVIGGVIDRFTVRRIATERIGAALRSLQQWCEDKTP